MKTRDLQIQLKKVYNNTPDEVKAEAWKIFGRSDDYFRKAINISERVSQDAVMQAIQSLKQAYANKEVEYIENFQDKKNTVEDLETEFSLLRAKQIETTAEAVK